MKIDFKAILIAILLFETSIKAQETKALDLSFIGIAHGCVPNTGVDSLNNTFYFISYQDLMLDWYPWHKRNNRNHLSARILATQGNGATSEAVNDLQVFSNIEAGNYIGLFELYYSHYYKNHSIDIGQTDLCRNFMALDAALYFANSSFGALPTLTLNYSAPVFPTGALSFIYRFEREKWNFSLGLFDGYVGNTETNKNNLNPSLSSQDGALLISEFKYQYSEIESDQFVAGIYNNSNKSNDTVQSQTSYYAMIQKSLGRKMSNDEYKLQIFGQASITPYYDVLVSQYYSVGAIYNDVFNFSKSNDLGLGSARIHLSESGINSTENSTKAETAIEAFYDLELLKWLYIRPSFTYISNAGATASKRHVTVSSLYLRIEL